MPRTTDTLTPRQRQSQQAMREKKAKKRRESLRRKLQFGGGLLLGAVVMGAALFFYSKQDSVDSPFEIASRQVYAASARAGFAVRSLHVEGRNRTPMPLIIEALAIRKNAPILEVSPAELRRRLQALHTVRDASVDRALPDALHVRIVEREPVALWQNQGAIALVDDQGVVMPGLDVATHKALPLIVGDGAPEHIRELLQVLAASPRIAREFASAIRVGGRRWNIRLRDDLEIKLPESGAASALARLASMDEEHGVLKRSIKAIDLRIPDRVFMKLSPEIIAAPHPGAKDA